MKLPIAGVFVLSMATSACGSDGATPGSGGANPSGGAAVSGSQSGGASNAGTSGQGAGGKNDGKAGATSSQAGNAPTTPVGSTPSPMPVISRDVPAFASSDDDGATAENAQDGKPNTSWASGAMPAWLAYDLSGVAAAKRGRVLASWYAGAALDFINPDPDPDKRIPVDFTIETNSAAGGGAAPKDGWQVVKTVTGNDRNSRQCLFDMDGANWVRINVTKSTNPTSVGIDFDVHSAPDGATDSWLFMGDSITFMSTSYLFSDLPEQVNKLASDRWPAVIPAAIGGTNTTTAMEAFDTTTADFPGRFVVLAYGTNDHPGEYQMEDLVKRVIAAGKAPVVPHMPWSTDPRVQLEGPQNNEIIDRLYEKYPEIVRGPDFWAIFTNKTDLIPAGDVHPNDGGKAEFRKQWAVAMTK
jgi:hypothetical protein